MLHDLDQNLHINGLFFLQNLKKLILGVFLGIIPKMRFFPKNPAPSVCYPEGKNMRSFKKNSISYFGENGLSTDLLTY